ncbi:MAG: helix-turn-helix domain-containing protein [Clostridia bacterium]|nr:helix-turn-helix domain-containing protein [Clostridia bacterium]
MENKMTYSVSETAQLLGISRSVAYNLCKQPGFPVIRISPNRLLVLADGLRKWLAEQTA